MPPTHTSTALTNVSYLEVGGHVTSAFAGVGSIGFELTGVDFGILMVGDTKNTAVATDDVNYMALKADVATAGLVGIDGLTAEVSSLSVVVNKTSSLTAPNTVLDFVNSDETINTTDTNAATVSIATGPDSADVILDIDGDEGVLLAVMTNLTLDVFGFVQLDGSLAFKKATGSFTVTNASTHTSTALTNVSYLEVGGHVTSAFAGVGSIGFELTGVDFGILMVGDTKNTAVTTDDVNYMALKADVATAGLVGIDGLTAEVSSLSVVVNKTSSLTAPNTVLDFVNSDETINTTDTNAATVSIATGPDSADVILDIDGDEGVLLAVMTNLTLDVFGFVQLDGSLAFKKATGSFTVTDASTHTSTALNNVSYLEVGGHVTSAFAGVGSIGFELTGVDFGILMVGDTKNTAVATDDVNYMALKADVATAGLVGIDGLTAEVSSLSVVVNKTSSLTAPNTVLDFVNSDETINTTDTNAATVSIATGPDSADVILDIDGDEGVLLAVMTNLTLDVFGFVQLDGSLAFKKATGSFTVTDASTHTSTALNNVSYLEVGGHVTSAFAGVGSIGFELTGVDFGILMVGDTKNTAVTTDDVNYMALKADVATAGLVGIDGLTAEVSSLSVVVNKTSSLTAPNTVLDFVNSDETINTTDTNAATVSIATGPDSADVILDIDGDEGVLLAVMTNLTLDVFGFVQLDGSLAFKKATGSFIVTDAGTHTSTALNNVSYLEVGGHVTSAFAGVGSIGFELTGVDFGILMVGDTKNTAVTTDDVNYMALKADVASAGLVGIDGLTAEVSSLSVVVNKTSSLTAPNSVLDFVDTADNTTDTNAATVSIATGPDSADVILDIDGDEGVLLAVMTNLTLDVFGFVQLDGSLAFKKATGSFIVTDAGTHTSTALNNVSYLEVGGHVTSAFAGVGSIGFELTGVDFGILMVGDTKGTVATTDDVNYMALKADVGSAGLVGIDGLTAEVTSLSVVVNKTSSLTAPNSVLDFVDTADNTTDTNAATVSIATGPDSADVILDIDGDEGVLLAVMTNLTLDVFGFVQLDGSLAFKKATGSFTVTNASTHTSTALTNVSYLEVGGHVTSAFAGVGSIGFELTGVDFGILMVGDTKNTAVATDDVNYMALKADVATAGLVGIDGLTAEVTSLSVVVNKTSSLTAPNSVLDFVDTADNTTDTNAATVSIATGPDSADVILDIDGDEGVLLAVMTNLTLDVFGFVQLDGSLAFKKATGSFTVTDAGTHTSTALNNVSYLEVGGHVTSAFAGVGSIGFELTGVDFGILMVGDTKGTVATTDDVNYMALKADVATAGLVGIDGLTAEVTSLSVVVNKTSSLTAPNSVLDFVDTADNTTDTNAATVSIATGPDSADVILDIDGDEGVLLAVMTNLTLDVFGFVQLDGSLAFKKATGSFTVTNASTHTSTALTNVSYLEVGGHVTSAFAGVGSIGFELTGVDFGILMVGDTKNTAVATDDVNYMALKADVATAGLVGIDGLTAEVSSLSVVVNKTSSLTAPNTVLDFVNSDETINTTDTNAATVSIATGPDSADVILDIDGDEGVLLAVMTNLTLDVFGFVQLDGSLAFKKATGSFTVTDASTHTSASLNNVSYLEVGGHVTSAFAGVGSIGFELTGVDFGILMVGDTKNTAVTTDDVNYMALKADVASAGLVGIDGLTAEVSSLSVVVNKTSSLTAPNTVLDFVNSDETINTTDTNAATVSIATGPDSADVILDIDGDEGVLLAVMTNLTLNVFGFVQLDGSLAFKKATGSFTVTNAGTHTSTALNNVSYLEVGGHVTSAFAGVGSIGFELTGVDFGILMVGDTKGTVATTDDVNYMALKADVATAGLVGIDGLTAEVSSLSVVVNKTSSLTAPNTVLDFVNSDETINTTDTNAANVAIATGPDSADVILDIDGDEGVLLAVMTNLTLDVFGFVSLDGSLAFKKATGSFTVTNAGTHTSTALNNVSYLEVGGHVTSAFAGVGSIGFELTGVDFGILMVGDTKNTAVTTDDVNYMALKADVASAGLVGIDGLTAEVSSLSVVVNKTSSLTAPNTVLDFVNSDETINTTDTNAATVSIATGPDSADVILDIDGDEGVLLAVMTNLTLNVFGFVQLDGSLAFKKATGSFTVTNAGTHTSTALNNVSYLEVGGHVTSAFAGVGSIGFELTGVDFGILMVGDTKGTVATTDDVNYMALKADVATAGLVGIDGLTAEVSSLSVVVNKTSSLTAPNTVLDFVNSDETINTTDTNAATVTIATGPDTADVILEHRRRRGRAAGGDDEPDPGRLRLRAVGRESRLQEGHRKLHRHRRLDAHQCILK